jgi:hypothetical protein
MSHVAFSQSDQERASRAFDLLQKQLTRLDTPVVVLRPHSVCHSFRNVSLFALRAIGAALSPQLTAPAGRFLPPADPFHLQHPSVCPRGPMYPWSPLTKGLDRYGQKHKNSATLAHQVKQKKLHGIIIPPSEGISTPEVRSFLNKQAPRVLRGWNALSKVGLNHPLASEGCLIEIREGIGEAFSQQGHQFPFSKRLSSWLAEQAGQGNRLMVRSSGAGEDTKAGPLAGGYVSEAYVQPDKPSVLKAVEKVVQSYFTRRALQMRISAGADPFKEEPQFAVTIQPVIGEAIGGAASDSEVPASFVLSIDGSGIVTVSATFGHGEGVTGSHGMVTDTAWIAPSAVRQGDLSISYHKRIKPDRLAPLERGGKVTLCKIPNSPSLQTRRAITEGQLWRLYRAAHSLASEQETHFEGVIKNDEIYLVQQRQIHPKPLSPTYLDSSSVAPREQVEGEVLVPGEASVVFIEDKEELLVASTLAEAENIYHARSAEGKSPYKAVLVSHPEPPLSHPVVEFSSLGVPCLHAPHSGQVRRLLDRIDAERHVALCMQRGTINLVERKKTVVQEGFSEHPAQIAISLPVRCGLAPHLFPRRDAQEAKRLFRRLSSARNSREALRILAALEQGVRMNSLPGRIKQFASRLSRLSHPIPPAQERLQALRHIERQTKRAFGEVQALLSRGPADRREQLFRLKVLQTLVLGSKGSDYCLFDQDALSQSIEELLHHQEALSHPSHAADLLLMGATLGREGFASWKQWINKWEKAVEKGQISAREWSQFKQLVGDIDRSGILPLWFSFLPQRMSLIEQLRGSLAEAGGKNGPLVEQLLRDQREIERLSDSLDQFINPQSFPKAWKELRSKIERYGSSAWLDPIGKGSALSKIVALQLMERMIAFTDTAIKKVYMSQQFPDPSERKRFLDEMVDVFASLINSWAHQLAPGSSFYVDSRVGFSEIHQTGLSLLVSTNQRLFGAQPMELSRLPKQLKKAMRLVEQPKWGERIHRVGIKFSPDAVIAQFNVPLREHSGQVALIYDLREEKLIFSGVFSGGSDGRWEFLRGVMQTLEEAQAVRPVRPVYGGHEELSVLWNIDDEQLEKIVETYFDAADYSMGGEAHIPERSYYGSRILARWGLSR